MVSIRYFSGEAALSCRKVIPEEVVTSVNLIALSGAGQARTGPAEAAARSANCLRRCRLERYATKEIKNSE